MHDEESYWGRTMQRRLSRRGAIRGSALAGLGLAGAALIGCGEEEEAAAPAATAAPSTPAAGGTTAPSGAAQPKTGGTLHDVHVPGFTYQHLDPHAAVWTAGFTWSTHSLLVKQDITSHEQSEWTIEPDAAASWEEPDATTYVFHLAENLNFHDIPPANGRAATSADVKYSIEHMNTNEPQFFRRLEFKSATIETPDDKTVVIKFPQPTAAFWNRITTPGTVIVPPEMHEQEGATLFRSGKPFPGTGPFMNQKFVQDQSFSVERNPKYFKEGRPYLDKIEGVASPNRDATWVKFRAKEIDYSDVPTRDYYEEALKMEGVTVDLRVGLRSHWNAFHTEKPPFDDARVRRAISLATPRQDIIDTAHRGEEDGVMMGPGGLTPFVHGGATWTYEELKKRPGYRSGKDYEADVAEAKKLLDAAGFTGYKGRYQFSSGWPFGDAQATLQQEAYKAIGFDLTLQAFPYSDTLVNLANRDFEIYNTAQYGNGVDPNEYLEFYFADKAPRNYGEWKSPRYNELLAKQAQAVDVEERNQIIHEMLELLDEEQPRNAINNWVIKAAFYDYLHGWTGNYSSMLQNRPDIIWLDK